MWAFRVWRTAGAGIQEALRRARLRVPTLSAWLPGDTGGILVVVDAGRPDTRELPGRSDR